MNKKKKDLRGIPFPPPKVADNSLKLEQDVVSEVSQHYEFQKFRSSQNEIIRNDELLPLFQWAHLVQLRKNVMPIYKGVTVTEYLTQAFWGPDRRVLDGMVRRTNVGKYNAIWYGLYEIDAVPDEGIPKYITA